MKNIIKIELEKALKGKWFRIVLLAAFVITLINTWEILQTTMNDIRMTEQIRMEQKEWVVLSAYSSWIGMETYTLGYSLYFFYFPLFAALAYGWSFCQDRESGYIRQVISRIGRRPYFLAKYIATFVAGGLAAVLPLVGNMLLGMTYRNLALPDPIYQYFGIGPLSFLGELYYRHPFVSILLYLIIDFLFCGALACVSMTLAFWLRKKIFVLVIPFLALIGWDYLALNYLVHTQTQMTYTASLLRMVHMGPLLYYNPGGVFLLSIATLFLITLGVTLFRGRRYDVL